MVSRTFNSMPWAAPTPSRSTICTGTDIKQVAIDLAAAGTNSGDGAPDQVIVNGTAGDDMIKIARDGSTVTVNGLAAQVTIAHPDATDTLVVNGLGGNDTIDASALSAGHMNVMLNGGDGNDTHDWQRRATT